MPGKTFRGSYARMWGKKGWGMRLDDYSYKGED